MLHVLLTVILMALISLPTFVGGRFYEMGERGFGIACYLFSLMIWVIVVIAVKDR